MAGQLRPLSMNEPMAPPVLRIERLSFGYEDQPALVADWSATLPAGVTLLHGDTGSGKSTLLRVFAGELRAQGRLTLAGVVLDDDAEGYRAKRFFVEPGTDGFDQLSARACIAALSAGDARFDEAGCAGLIDGFSLAPHIDKPMYMLSTGSKRKVWLAAALASGRELVLLDEPASALDAASVVCLTRALALAAEQRTRAVVVASAGLIELIPLAARLDLPLG
jgi:ABC-type multidrug transport system ATPase subunit